MAVHPQLKFDSFSQRLTITDILFPTWSCSRYTVNNICHSTGQSPQMPLQVLLLYPICFRPYLEHWLSRKLQRLHGWPTTIQTWNAGVGQRKDQRAETIMNYPKPETHGPSCHIHFRWRIQISSNVPHGFCNHL